MDLPRTKKGHTALMVVVDRLSKRVVLIATKTEVTAIEAARLFFDNVVRHHGLPDSIVSDRDPRFTSRFWEGLFDLLGTKLARSTAQHPQTDGQTERLNRTLEQMLRAYVSFDMNNWDDLLTAAEFAINNAVHSSTKLSPFELDTGQRPRIPVDLLVPTNLPAVSDFATQLATALGTAKDNLREAQRMQALHANRRRRDVTFAVGDKVLIKSTALLTAYERARPKRKLKAVYVGPFVISAVISTTAYRLQLPPAHQQVHPVFHVSQLKAYRTPTALQEEPPEPPPDDIEGHPEYEVDIILQTRLFRGQRQYLIKWKGYPDHDVSWESEQSLTHAKDVLNDFWAARPRTRSNRYPSRQT